VKTNYLAILVIICFSVSCTTKADNSASIIGTWIPVSQEMAGNEMPPTMFKTHRLIIEDNTYTMHAESIDKGAIAYSNGKMDVYGEEGVNKGNHFTAIYKVTKEQLTICYNLAGDSYPSDFETKSNPMHFLAVFERTN